MNVSEDSTTFALTEYSDTRPGAIVCCGAKRFCMTWSTLYSEALKMLAERSPEVFLAYEGKAILGEKIEVGNFEQSYDFARSRSFMKNAEGRWLYADIGLDASQILLRLNQLAAECGVPAEEMAFCFSTLYPQNATLIKGDGAQKALREVQLTLGDIFQETNAPSAEEPVSEEPAQAAPIEETKRGEEPVPALEAPIEAAATEEVEPVSDNAVAEEPEITEEVAPETSSVLPEPEAAAEQEAAPVSEDLVANETEEAAPAIEPVLSEESEKPADTTWQDFLQWLHEDHPLQEKTTLSSLRLVNMLGRKAGLMKKPVSEIHDPKEIVDLIQSVANSTMAFQSKKNANAAKGALKLYADFLKEGSTANESGSIAAELPSEQEEATAPEVQAQPDQDAVPEVDSTFTEAAAVSPSTPSVQEEQNETAVQQSAEPEQPESAQAENEALPQTDPLLDYLTEHQIRYIDLRVRGGCLWISGSHELDDVADECAETFGVDFFYKWDGSNCMDGPCWWTKDIAKQLLPACEEADALPDEETDDDTIEEMGEETSVPEEEAPEEEATEERTAEEQPQEEPAEEIAAPEQEQPVASAAPAPWESTFQIPEVWSCLPRMVTFKGKTIRCESWKQIYVDLVKEIYQLYPEKVGALVDRDDNPTGVCIAVLHKKKTLPMKAYTFLLFADGQYLYLKADLTPQEKVESICKLLNWCGGEPEWLAFDGKKASRKPKTYQEKQLSAGTAKEAPQAEPAKPAGIAFQLPERTSRFWYTVPDNLMFNGRPVTAHTWKQLYAALVKAIYLRCPTTVEALRGKPNHQTGIYIVGANGLWHLKEYIALSKDKSGQMLYLDAAKTPYEMLDSVCKLMDWCGLNGGLLATRDLRKAQTSDITKKPAGAPATKQVPQSTPAPVKKPMAQSTTPATNASQPKPKAQDPEDAARRNFEIWLLSKKHMKPDAAQKYANAITSCEDLALLEGLPSTNLYLASAREAAQTKNLLTSSTLFLQQNRARGNLLSHALDAYFQYLTEISSKNNGHQEVKNVSTPTPAPRAVPPTVTPPAPKPVAQAAPVQKAEPAVPVPPAPVQPQSAQHDSDVWRLDFSEEPSLAYTQPIEFSYSDGARTKVSNWTQLYVQVTQRVVEDNPEMLRSHINSTIDGRGKRLDFADVGHAGSMIAPKKIADNFYLETNISATGIVAKIKALLDLCGVDYEMLDIYYRKKDSAVTPPAPKPVAQAAPVQKAEPVTTYTPHPSKPANRKTFEQWLRTSGSLSEGSINSYASAITACEEIARRCSLSSSRLYGASRDEATQTVRLLQAQPEYQATNARQSNRLNIAIARYMAFLSLSVVAENATAPAPGPTAPAPAKPVVQAPAKSWTPPVSARLVEKLERIVLEADLDGVALTQLYNDLSESELSIRTAVQASLNLLYLSGSIYHKDAFVDFEVGADKLEQILEKLMERNNGYVSETQLYEHVRLEMQMFLNDNGLSTSAQVYDLARYLFEKAAYHGTRYTFKGGTHISRAGDGQIGTVLDVMRRYAREQGGFFTKDGLEGHLQSVGLKTGNLYGQMRIGDEPIFLFYASGTFITAESMRMDAAWFDRARQALERLFDDLGDHIVLRDINPWWYRQLPPLPGGREWTPLLLQSVLGFYSEKLGGARTIKAMDTQSRDTLHAMLVSGKSELHTFPDAVAAWYVDDGIEEKRFTPDNLRARLVSRGLIAGNELIYTLPKALDNDPRFAWNADNSQVLINL